ncbi:GTPase IMAP family member 4-like [Ictalurus furcatus]|uniref:GTPase IMAP family member 4-like n=1 Tax=Ictalurus furcatus TaxID=66913 RepID=UPI00235044E6|nr:GTPase IMAP family member 4-like [Ictalurus furcatus]XP_053503933.1 GTPase IMAP family member 4-like [Ictalurus furcatus]
MNVETVWRRWQKEVTVADVDANAAQQDETELSSLFRCGNIYSHRSASDEPKSDLRLVLLGGDCTDNGHASSIILRSVHMKLAIHPKKGNIREGTIDGRQVSVFVAPSYWMNHLSSYMIFSNGVESIRDEIQNCTSLTFPGPHAFLLVMRAGHTTGKEHHLLKAITYMFGAEALRYTMVLFVYGHEWENPTDALKNRCVKMCGARYYFLENSDENVQELFGRVEGMMRREKSRFFIQHSYENLMMMYFQPWERARVYKETELKRELEELKTELEASRRRECALQEDLDAASCSEKQLRKEMAVLKGSEAGQWECLRHNSIEFTPPVMTENQNITPLDDL